MSDRVKLQKGKKKKKDNKEETGEGKARLVTTRGAEQDGVGGAASELVTLSSFISPSSCTISSLRLSCRDDIRCSSSSFLCLKHTANYGQCRSGDTVDGGQQARRDETRGVNQRPLRDTISQWIVWMTIWYYKVGHHTVAFWLDSCDQRKAISAIEFSSNSTIFHIWIDSQQQCKC